MGSTEIFFPGIWKAAAPLEDGAAVVLSAAADMPSVDEGLLLGAAFDVDGGGGVVDGVVTAAGLETEENPTTDTPGFTGLVDTGGGEEVEEGGALDDVEAAVVVEGGSDCAPRTILHCRTTCTRRSPLLPMTGVNVTVHVSVASPEGVLIVCTV